MAKIMLVEDDNNLREIYEARLMAEGYEIVTARDGEEALAVAVKERPDLVISDVMMPKISGFDMLDILRSTPETKNVKVIMMTALSQVEDKERATKLGADRYLVKSQVTLEDVAKVAHEVLEGVTTSGAPVPAGDTAAPAAAQEPAAAEPAEPATPAQPAAPTESSIPPATPAPEPSTTTPVEPVAQVAVTAPVMDPVTAPAPTPITTAAPAATEDTTAAPSATEVGGITDLSDTAAAAEPVAAEPATPVVEEEPADEPDTDIVRPAAEVWTLDNPATPAEPEAQQSPAVSEAATKQVEAAEAHIDASGAQSIEDEEAAIAKQIEVMIGDPAPAEPATDAAPEVPLPETTEPAAEAAPEVPAPETTEPSAPAEPASESSTSSETPSAEPAAAETTTTGQKVIQPINDPSKPTGPDIHELAAKEEANEAAHVGGSVISPTGEVSNPMQPGTTAAPKPGGIDPNSLAL